EGQSVLYIPCTGRGDAVHLTLSPPPPPPFPSDLFFNWKNLGVAFVRGGGQVVCCVSSDLGVWDDGDDDRDTDRSRVSDQYNNDQHPPRPVIVIGRTVWQTDAQNRCVRIWKWQEEMSRPLRL